MLAPVMTLDRGAEIYSPGGRLLETGGTLAQPGLADALTLLADEGARSAYDGSLADALLALIDARGGAITRDDLRSYSGEWKQPVAVGYASHRVLTRGGLARMAPLLAALPPLRELSEAERVCALVPLLDAPGPETHTTNVSIVDGAGNACAFTTSLGLGSGDFVPGLDLHLNSMLGETDLVVGDLRPGERMESMMAPSVVTDGAGLAAVAGSAGGTRLRTALTLVLAGVLDEGLDAQAAIDRPRFHPTGATVNAEPGVSEEALEALEADGRHVRRWPARHHYFGGVSGITRRGAGADPRRSGAVRTPR
jgi:gamma-glutamyltranspeptidase/glutathione hydrolase